MEFRTRAILTLIQLPLTGANRGSMTPLGANLQWVESLALGFEHSNNGLEIGVRQGLDDTWEQHMNLLHRSLQ